MKKTRKKKPTPKVRTEGKINGVGEKRQYLGKDFKFYAPCPECRTEEVLFFDGEHHSYLSYPTFNEGTETLYGTCPRCSDPEDVMDDGVEIEVRLVVSLELVE